MDIVRLRHIVAVYRHRSFSRAADEAGITQPALSRSISSFEKRYGVTLFDRSRAGVHPTAAGFHVIDEAQRLLAAAADLERSMKRFPHETGGRVALGVGPLIASLFLPQLSCLLLAKWPGLKIVTLTRPPDQLVGDLLEDRIEFIVGNNWNLGRLQGTEVERVGRLRIAPIARADHPLAKEERLTAADLEAYPVAMPVDMPGGSAEAAGGLICDNFHVLRDTVLLGDCTWLSSPDLLHDDLQSGRLVILDAPALKSTSDISIVSKRSRSRSPAAAMFVEELRALAGAL